MLQEANTDVLPFSVAFSGWTQDEHKRLVGPSGHRREPRSAEDHGWYVSIELSDDYLELSPGYFVVVVAGDSRKRIWAASRQTKAAGVEAYARYVSDETWRCGS